ncbi:hypothetical protein CRG98_048760, partial [Punica granatum]
MAKFFFFALIALLSVHLALSADPPQISPSPTPKLVADSTLLLMRLTARSHSRRRCLPQMRLPPLP